MAGTVSPLVNTARVAIPGASSFPGAAGLLPTKQPGRFFILLSMDLLRNADFYVNKELLRSFLRHDSDFDTLLAARGDINRAIMALGEVKI